jgi:SOS-response transcriptional repressor LexA
MDHDWHKGEFSDAGCLLGHVHLGTSRLEQFCRHLKFPEALRIQLLHALLAHHDELEFGSPVRPMTAEAIAVAKCDQMSAELTAYFDALREKLPEQRKVKRGDRWFFFGERDLSGDLGVAYEPADDPEERLLRRLSAGPVGVAGASRFGVARLPVLGTVAAGDGVQSAEADGADGLDVLLPEGGADFLLRVVGDSMSGAGICEGDLLMVRRQETARAGQIVIAHAPGQGNVVKRLTETPKGRFLTSENPAYDPIPVTPDVRVQGVVVRLERML